MASLYFDHNATTPLCSAAREAWLDVTDRYWHNPSSLYPDAGAAKRRLEDERESLADMLGVDTPERVAFTSGATEANNAAIAAIASANPSGRAVASKIEHPSVLAPLSRHFEGRWRTIPCEDFRNEIAGASLAAVMAANNETGSILPVAEFAATARDENTLFLCDATQCFGKLDVGDVESFGDIVVGSAHKFGGPKGTGFAVLSEQAADLVFQCGGPQESRRRAGTEDLASIAAMIAALESAKVSSAREQAAHRDAFEYSLAARIPGTRALADDNARLPNTSMLVMPSGKNLKWLTRLGRRGVSISTGSACSSGAENGSHVLAAMGLSIEEIGRALRISSGSTTSSAEWHALANEMVAVWKELSPYALSDRKPTLDLGSL